MHSVTDCPLIVTVLLLTAVLIPATMSCSFTSPSWSVRLWIFARNLIVSPSCAITGVLSSRKKSFRVMSEEVACPTKATLVQPRAVNRHSVVDSGNGIFTSALPSAFVMTGEIQREDDITSLRGFAMSLPLPFFFASLSGLFDSPPAIVPFSN